MDENKEKVDKEETGFVILGGDSDYKRRLPWWIWTSVGCVLFMIVIFFVVKTSVNHGITEANANSSSSEGSAPAYIWYNNEDESLSSHIDITEMVVDSISLKILTPYNVIPELHLGEIDTSDTEILFAALAADIRRDNGKIVGAFVHEGEPCSWGLSKRGYCAIFDDEITLGVADNSPLFEQATEQGASFFRQYPAVDNGKMVANNPENQSFRRTLCALDGKICIIVSTNRVLMNDFSTALVKLGVRNAIFLVGSTEDGWYRTSDGKLSRLGKKYTKTNPNINYLVFRAR